MSSPASFEIQAVRPGVWAAISSDPVWAVANAGIVDLGGRTLVWDCGSSPQAAQVLRNLAEDLTGQTVSVLALSHHHLDHCLGTQVFADTTLISSRTSNHLLQARFERLQHEANTFPMALVELHRRLRWAETDFDRRLLEAEIA